MKEDMRLLESWFESIHKANPVCFEELVSNPVTIEGSVDFHLGGKTCKAAVTFVVSFFEHGISYQPDLVHGSNKDWELECASYAAYGFLDVVLTQFIAPVSNLLLKVTKLEVDPINSSPSAFRLAGREAGRAFWNKLKDIRRVTSSSCNFPKDRG